MSSTDPTTDKTDPKTMTEELEQGIFSLAVTLWKYKADREGKDSANSYMLTLFSTMAEAYVDEPPRG